MHIYTLSNKIKKKQIKRSKTELPPKSGLKVNK